MQTREITKEELGKAEVICYGFKAINYDSTTKAGDKFRYGKKGEKLVGKIFTVDGEIQECQWDLYFSKAPAYVFNFYEPFGYNRYFKIAAYNSVVDDKEGVKSVAQTIEFVEEYDLMKYIDLIKDFDRRSPHAVNYSGVVSESSVVSDSAAVGYSNAVSFSKAVSLSTAVRYSNAVHYSDAVSYSNAVHSSYAVHSSNAVRSSSAVSLSNAVSNSNAVFHSNAVRYSAAVRGSIAVHLSNAVSDSIAVCNSDAVHGSYGIRRCDAIKYGIFCYAIECKKYVLFNKRVTEGRYKEVYQKIRDFNFFPHFDNFYELKGNKEWWALCFPELREVDNKTAWSKMPKEMLEYIKSLPEYDEEIFKNITEE